MRCDAIRFDWIIIIITVYPMRLLRTLFDTSLLLIIETRNGMTHYFVARSLTITVFVFFIKKSNFLMKLE